MALTTCNVLCTVNDDAGTPVQGATVSAKLNQFEVYNGYVVPQLVEGTTNANGQVTLALWPNQLGSTESMYVVKIAAPNGKRLTVNAVVPNVSNTELHLIAELPPYDGKSDGQFILDAAVAAGSTAIAKAAEAASSASAAATSATNAATSASAAAGSATSAAASAATANTKASEAAFSASGAATSASTASSKASEASASATNAATSANTASTKASEAATSATSAGSSATSAANSATTATSKASEASSSASSASAAKLAAEAARDQTLAAFDNFDDRYLGPKASDPTVDNDGNALVGGALYFNTSAMNAGGGMKVYDSTAHVWLAAYASLSGALLSANNLADLASANAARTNLGLGNVENKSSATIRGELTSGNVTNALGYTPYSAANPNGYITSAALSGYLTSATAASTYQTQAGMSLYLPLAGGTLTGNLTFGGASQRIIGDFTSTTRLLVQTSAANSNTVFGLIPSGTAVNSQFHVWGAADITNAPLGAFTINSAQVQIQSSAAGTGTVLPFRLLIGSTEVFRATTNYNFLIGTSTDDGVNKLQVNGSIAATQFNGSAAGLTGFKTVNGNSILGTGDVEIPKYQNRIINGGMLVNQRTPGQTVTLGSLEKPVIDRFFAANSSSALVVASHLPASLNGQVNRLRLSVTTGAAAVANQRLELYQPIEGFLISDLGWGSPAAQSVTLSFRVSSSIPGTYAGSVTSGNRSYVFTYTVSAANVLESKTVTIPGPTSGTWQQRETFSAWVRFDFGSTGSVVTASPASWLTGSFRTVAGAVNIGATTGAVVEITDIQLQPGNASTIFERRPYGVELLLCQRYFQKTYNMAVPPGAANAGESGAFVVYSPLNASGQQTLNWRFAVPMRAAPVGWVYNPFTGGEDQFASNNLSPVNAGFGYSGEGGCSIDVDAGAAGANTTIYGHVVVSADVY